MRIAAIDIGTNSVHMIVCRIRPDLSFEVIDREKDMIRLGAGGLEGRGLAPAAMTTAMRTLAKFRRLAESHSVDEIIAAATSAVREAENGGDFVAAVGREVGLRVRVISGTEEARLIHLAAAYAIGVGPARAVVIDIGGGSTEITLGTATRVDAGRSFKLGAIRLTERFARTDPLTNGDERKLVKHIRRQTDAYLRQIARRHVQHVIGTSGTILALGGVAAGSRRAGDVRRLRVAARAVHRLRKRLVGMTLEERLKLPGLDPRRADLAVAGAVLLDTILLSLGADELTLCDFALREGLVLDYIAKNGPHIRKVDRYPDARRRSVVELAERCNYLPDHAAQVARLALALFDATADRHKLGAREREWLEYGALLHDIGSHISYERHHKHSYYLITQRGPAGLRSRGSRGHRAHRALSSPGAAAQIAGGLRRPASWAAAHRAAARRDRAPGRGARPQPRPGPRRAPPDEGRARPAGPAARHGRRRARAVGCRPTRGRTGARPREPDSVRAGGTTRAVQRRPGPEDSPGGPAEAAGL